MKKLLAILLAVFSFVALCSCSVMTEKDSKDTIDTDIWGTSIELAESFKNVTESYFTDKNNYGYHLKNSNLRIERNMLESKTDYYNAEGVLYGSDVLSSYIKTEDGQISPDYLVSNMNAYRIGYYYTDVHFQDMSCTVGESHAYLEEIYHTYSTRMYLQYRFVAREAVSDLCEYGIKLRFPKTDVNAVYVCNEGIATDVLTTGITYADADYVAFDIKNAGIFGYIPAISLGQCVSVDVSGDYCVLSVLNFPNTLDAANPLSVCGRLYNDSTHGLDGISDAFYEESTQLSVTVFSDSASGSYIGYDDITGAYTVKITGTDFNSAYYNIPDKHFNAHIFLDSIKSDRDIYIRVKTDYGNLENSVVLDENDNLLPITPEVSKNFHGEFEEPIYDPNDAGYGESVLPLHLKKDEVRELTVLHLYQNWGKYPLRQISSIQFYEPYYHMSEGVTETSCISPYYTQNTKGWTLPDFRALSGDLWDSQPQHNSAGIICHMRLNTHDNSVNEGYGVFDGSEVISSGPIYNKVAYSYNYDDLGIDTVYTHTENPQTDELRAYYTLNATFDKEIEVLEPETDFTLLSANGRSIAYLYMAYLNAAGEQKIQPLDKGGIKYTQIPQDGSYIALYSAKTSSNVCCFALIIRSFEAVIGGKEYTDNLLLGYNQNQGSFTLGLVGDTLTFKPGDYIKMDYILLPFGEAQRTRKDISSVLTVMEDSVDNPVTLDVASGEYISSYPIPTLALNKETNAATFTLSGGRNKFAVVVKGLKTPDAPTIYEHTAEGAVLYTVNSEAHSYDGYNISYNAEDGTYTYSFVVDMGDTVTNSRSFTVIG